MAKKRSAFILTLMLAFALLIPMPAYAWGDNIGGRDTHSLQEVNEGTLGDTITFNSISFQDSDYTWYKETTGEDLPSGIITEEVNFVGARMVGENQGAQNVWNGNEIKAVDGEFYYIRLYAHNNNPGGYDAVAEDTKVSFNIPQESAASIRVNGYITSANAYPSEYVDYVDFVAGQPFHLEYLYGSALLESSGIGANGGVTLSDDIVASESGGVLIGYDELNGRVPGGYEYASYITIMVKVVYDYSFALDTQVRLDGSANESWQKEGAAEIGDTVEFQLTYENTDNFTQEDVVIRSVLPDNLEYVAGSTVLYNVNYPNGLVSDTDTVVDNGINIGAYTAGSNAYIRFTAKVVDEDLAWGSNTLVNWGRASVGETVQQDAASVIVQNNTPFHILIVIFLGIAILSSSAFIILRIKIHKKKRYL